MNQATQASNVKVEAIRTTNNRDEIEAIEQQLFRSYTSKVERSTPKTHYWHPKREPKFNLQDIKVLPNHWTGTLIDSSGKVIAEIKQTSVNSNKYHIKVMNKIEEKNFYQFLETEYSSRLLTISLFYQEDMIDKKQWLSEQKGVACDYLFFLYNKKYPKKLKDFTNEAKSLHKAMHRQAKRDAQEANHPVYSDPMGFVSKIPFTPHHHRINPALPAPFQYSQTRYKDSTFTGKLYDAQGTYIGKVENQGLRKGRFAISFVNEKARQILMHEVRAADYINDVWSGFKDKKRVRNQSLVSHYLNFIYLSQFAAENSHS